MKFLSLLIVFLCAACVPAFAEEIAQEAPVVVAEQAEPYEQTIAVESLTIDQRLARLEQQLANQSNYADQVQNLQHQIQVLQGRFDEANHQIQVLQQYVDSKKIKASGVGKKAEVIKVNAIDIPIPTSITSTSPNNFLKEQDMYEKAYRFIKAHEYPQAISTLRAYLEQYPAGQYAGNAHYWLGELYLLQRKSADARVEFNTVIDKFPNNTKIALATQRLREIDVKSHAKD